MVQNIQNTIIILLSSFGIIYIYKCLFIFILRNKYDKEIYIIIPISDVCENTEQIVRSTAQRTLLMGKSKWDKVICVDYGCNERNKNIIMNLCQEYVFLEYMTSSQFSEIFY